LLSGWHGLTDAVERGTIVDLTMPRHLLVGVAVVMTMASLSGQALPPAASLDDVLDKLVKYVADYSRNFVGVVSEETYRQDVQTRGGTSRLRAGGLSTSVAVGFATDEQQSRTLKSDVLLVRAPAEERWLQFRDVFDVDGRSVRDREERLTKLFLAPSPSARKQVDDIVAASARYNIGGVYRDFNIPVLALTVLEPENRPGFAFRLGKKRGAGRDVEFREQRSDTLVRGSGEQSAPAYGRLTIEPATGRVLSTEFHADTATLKSEIDVIYGAEPAVGGILVPREMRETYESSGTRIAGRATYSRFRRYTVTVDETIKK
jgi:hypothetical protein